jgi:hypothetical protein
MRTSQEEEIDFAKVVKYVANMNLSARCDARSCCVNDEGASMSTSCDSTLREVLESA